MWKRWLSRVKGWSQRARVGFKTPFDEARPSLPQLFSERRLIWIWLSRAHVAQIALALFVLFGLYALPFVRHVVADFVCPPRVESVFLGLGRQEIAHPLDRRPSRRMSPRSRLLP